MDQRKKAYLASLLGILVLAGCNESGRPLSDGNAGPAFNGQAPIMGVKQGGTYVVAAGDTVATIADRTNTPVRTLIDLNNLQPPYILQSGQRLLLQPGAGGGRVLLDQQPGALELEDDAAEHGAEAVVQVAADPAALLLAGGDESLPTALELLGEAAGAGRRRGLADQVGEQLLVAQLVEVAAFPWFMSVFLWHRPLSVRCFSLMFGSF